MTGFSQADKCDTCGGPMQIDGQRILCVRCETAAEAGKREAMAAAMWVTASPHEWVWTHEQQVAMARYCMYAAQRLGVIRKQIESIVCTEGCDRGVILLSSDSPTHYDTAAKCQVYDNENFSPLGDALVKLHDLVAEK